VAILSTARWYNYRGKGQKMTISVSQIGINPPAFLAVAGDVVVTGQSVGAALDAAFDKLGDFTAVRVVVQKIGGDRYFSGEQLARFEELSAKQRIHRSAGHDLAPEESTELDTLIRADFAAMTERAKAALEEAK